MTQNNQPLLFYILYIYRFPILETSATAFCSTTGKKIPSKNQKAAFAQSENPLDSKNEKFNSYVRSCRLCKMHRLQKGQPIHFYRRNKSLMMVRGILPTQSLPSKTQKPDVDTIVSHALSNPDTSRHTTLKRRTILKTRANLSKRSPLTIRSFSQPS